MISNTLPSFWRTYENLDPSVKEAARRSYKIFASNPDHPSLRFKKLSGTANIWSVRINQSFRAVAQRKGDTVTWFWIGSHNDFDKLFD